MVSHKLNGKFENILETANEINEAVALFTEISIKPEYVIASFA